MKYITEHFFCSEKLLDNISEIGEIYQCIGNIQWTNKFKYIDEDRVFMHQSAYNKAFEDQFVKYGWNRQPVLHKDPKLVGDFMKNDIFVEIQFGNSSTIYRDYYKFHYGLMKNLLSIAVLIVPTKPSMFFPNRNNSITNMAEFDMASKYFKLLPIPVPILLIGLVADN